MADPSSSPDHALRRHPNSPPQPRLALRDDPSTFDDAVHEDRSDAVHPPRPLQFSHHKSRRPSRSRSESYPRETFTAGPPRAFRPRDKEDPLYASGASGPTASSGRSAEGELADDELDDDGASVMQYRNPRGGGMGMGMGQEEVFPRYRGWRAAYYHPVVQVVFLAFVCFMGPGLFNALNGLGGGGMVSPVTSANANSTLYATFAVAAFFAG